jgi:hypothetical protein
VTLDQSFSRLTDSIGAGRAGLGIGSLSLQRNYAKDGVMQRLGCVLLAVSAFAAFAFAGCSGRTTGASQIIQRADGSYSAKLNAVGSCDKGSPSTPCTAYMRWRVVGTNAWTNGPTITVRRKVSDLRRSQTATGLSPKAKYEYQVCGNEFSSKQRITCAGPSGRGDTTQKFVTIQRSAAGRHTPNPNHAGTNKSPGKKGAPAASPPGAATTPSGPSPASNASHASNSGGDGAGTSPLVPIAIAVGAGGLVLGGTWGATKLFRW